MVEVICQGKFSQLNFEKMSNEKKNIFIIDFLVRKSSGKVDLKSTFCMESGKGMRNDW